MSQIIKAFMGVFLTLFMAGAGKGNLGGHLGKLQIPGR